MPCNMRREEELRILRKFVQEKGQCFYITVGCHNCPLSVLCEKKPDMDVEEYLDRREEFICQRIQQLSNT